MRNDLAQLLVETPRRNGGETYRWHRHTANHGDLETTPTKEGIRRPYRERKEFGEYFAPLKGFLRKNCGRPWDKVFSELSASLHGGGTVVQHTKMHLLNDFVVLNPVWHGDVPHSPPHQNYGNQSRPLDGDYYVDRQGILRWAPRLPRRRYKRTPPARVAIDERSAYYKIGADWFRVWLKPLPMPESGTPPIFDVILKKWVRAIGRTDWFSKHHGGPDVLLYEWRVDRESSTGALFSAHGQAVVAYQKEQVSSRTIRREKLNERLPR
jgi:hypothetical protein